jgi:hypothetical protein
MSRFVFFLLMLVVVPLAHASGPVAPVGWDGSFDTKLPNGQLCCIPADLNGTGLVGGAFVLVSNNKKEFGLFALAYTSPLKERWQLLEKHPISLLPAFRVSIEPPGQFPLGGIKACITATRCTQYFASSANGPFKRANHARAR